MANHDRKTVLGLSNVIETVSGSTTVTSVTGPKYGAMYGFISFVRSMENFTASAFNSVPSWNFTPGRSLKVYVRPSSETVQLSAKRPSSVVKSGAFQLTSV